MVDESNRSGTVQDNRGRRVPMVAAVAVAAMLLVGAAGCGGGSSDSGSKSDGGDPKTTQSSGGGDSDSGSEEAAGDLPDPCDLVPIEKASEILGGESAEPESTSSDVGVATRTCTWQTQEGKDNPTLDGAGHILTLNVTSPPESMSMGDFWDSSKEAADDEASVPDCSSAFWMGGLLSALSDGVYLTGSAGLADTSEDAKASVTNLVSTACANASS